MTKFPRNIARLARRYAGLISLALRSLQIWDWLRQHDW